ncbi:GTP pyrophosphokinase [Marinobacter sediminicola]|uniref:GTP pyrophosphokinase n=1 Tax=Marinobacter sediminicola TaxID=3072994 RepID=UPI002811D5F9|nr:hypothetical protein [Marinobacter sp. F26243]
MKESDFLQNWHEEKSSYEAWGGFVAEEILSHLRANEIDTTSFLKVPPIPRLKTDASLLDKAFYRKSKKYKNPYDEIEDKVGVRFVVLLLGDIETINKVIVNHPAWEYDACKHFNEDRRRDPLLFTYQSVHFILRPKITFEFGGVYVPAGMPCEVQVRTLLQHAHAELTHDAIYKAKRAIQPEVHRTVAKSMALIETTDDFFGQVSLKLSSGPLEELGVDARLDGMYRSITGNFPSNQKSSIVIWDEFEDLITGDLPSLIESFLARNQFLGEIIVKKYLDNGLYQQSVVLFIYWMLKRKRTRLLKDWPLERVLLDSLATDLGISLENH